MLYYAPRAIRPGKLPPAETGAEPAPVASGDTGLSPPDAAHGLHASGSALPAPGSELFPARAGFVASRSAVGNAVARARAKRRLREGFRAHQLAFPAGLDLVFVARRSLNGLEPAALDQRFLDLCRRLFPTRVT